MKVLISKSAKPEQSEVNITLKGNKDCVDRLCAFLACIDYNGAVGHSATFALPWDGDGDDKINITGIDHKAYKDRIKDLEETKTVVEIVK
jgi:hypothetical protein